MKSYLVPQLLVMFAVASLLACIEPNQGVVPGRQDGSSEPDIATSDVPPTDVPPDLEPRDTSDVADLKGGDTDPDDTAEPDVVGDDVVDVGDDTETTTLPCLPSGCEAPNAAGCQVAMGWCWIANACVAAGTGDSRSACQVCDPLLDQNKWSPGPNNVACDDGLTCTKNDVCDGGVCRGQTDCPGAPDSCLSRVCDASQNACVESVTDGCFVDGACFVEEAWTEDGCGSCRSAKHDRGWTPGDAQEPDNSYTQAHQLATPTEMLSGDLTRGWMPAWDTSRLVPETDIDVFRFTHDAVFTLNMPYVRIHKEEGEGIRACVWMRCNPTEDNPDVVTNRTCGGAAGTTTETRDDWVGCCRTSTAAQVIVGINTGACQAQAQFVTTTRQTMIEVQRSAPMLDTGCVGYGLSWGLK